MQKAGQLVALPWMTASPTLAVMTALSAGGSTPRFVGGCVRDAILARAVKDIDIATPDTPDQVLEKLANAGLKSVPTGLKHGTVTAISAGQPFEVTTLRRDVETDGRHAEVAFTDDWAEDAARRDLTINAIYCDADGTLYDPVGGLADIGTGTIRFVGDSLARIQEDVLRILRFFRFFAHYGEGDIDASGYDACRSLAHLLPGLSAERVSAEVLRLLTANEPTETVELMAQAGVLAQILPGGVHMDHLQELVRIEKTLSLADPVRRLFALCQPDRTGATDLARRFRLSNAQGQRLVGMAAPLPELLPEIPDSDLRLVLYRSGANAVYDICLLNQAADPALVGWQDLCRRIENWQPVAFPVKGRDALALGMPAGPEVGELLEVLERWWIEEDFGPDRSACLEKLRSLISPV